MLGLLALLAILAMPGCDEEPSCTLSTTMTGGYEGLLQWQPSGRDSCGIGDPTSIDPNGSAFAFIDRSTALNQYLYVFPHTPVPSVGIHQAQVLFIVGDNFWDSGANACTVQIVEFTPEPWSLIDFLKIRGTVTCPDPLTSPTNAEAINMAELLFIGHFHDERLPFDFL